MAYSKAESRQRPGWVNTSGTEADNIAFWASVMHTHRTDIANQAFYVYHSNLHINNMIE